MNNTKKTSIFNGAMTVHSRRPFQGPEKAQTKFVLARTQNAMSISMTSLASVGENCVKRNS
jgi:hypothetical protein